MSSFCANHALELVKELDRQPNDIPPYNNELVNKSVEEMEVLNEQNSKDAEVLQTMKDSLECSQDDFETSRAKVVPSVIARHATIERNKRCLMAYLNERMKRLKAYRWEKGGVIPPHIRVNLSESELEFFNAYSGALSSFMLSIGNEGIDLTLHTEPPQSLFVQIRCLQDYGDLQLPAGRSVLLQKNSIHSLPTMQAMTLIKQGVVEKVRQ